MTPEGLVRNTICSWLRWHKAWFTIHDSVGIYDTQKKCFRSNKSPYRLKGIPDILGIWKGKFLAIEVKVKGSYPTPEQKLRIQEINEHGGIAFVARSIEDVVANLEKIA